MSESLAVGRAQTRPAGRTAAAAGAVGIAALDARRKLQLALGVIWVLDGILQFQPPMFTKSFPDMLAESAHGNPGVVAGPITWSANLIDHHVVVLNAIFATVQLALGLGIAWRPTLRLALAASIAWSLAVWWLGEGFGAILAGTASPVSGAPGPVILYAILAVLLWPADRDPGALSVAGRAAGRRPAQAVWLVLWGSLAAFALLPTSRFQIGKGQLQASEAAQCELLVQLPEGMLEQPGIFEFAVRHLCGDREIGRVTWRFVHSEHDREAVFLPQVFSGL